MIEPVYTLDDGKKVPYVPIEIKTHRDAYAATLHVLFKHVADFHICIVKAFSKKYGIPEDDILQTIQESEEFKNMHVDPALDPLGYLAQAPVKEPVKEPMQAPAPVQAPAPMQAPAPVKEPVQSPVQAPAPTQSVQEPVAKKRIIKKKTAASSETATTSPETTATTSPETTATTATTAPIEKRKVIRKKVTNTPVISETVITDERTDVIASVEQVSPIAHLLATNVPATQKKIIRKKINS
jgi:hypothetical protein